MTLFTSLLTGFVATLVSIVVLSPLAIRTGLVDKPGGRKQHQGNIPLIGGIAIFIGVALGVSFWPEIFDEYLWLLMGCLVLLAVGVLDDWLSLTTKVRFAAQILVAYLIARHADNNLYYLGNLWYYSELHTGRFVLAFTTFAVVGVINAINMIDGIDGLAISVTMLVSVILMVIAQLSGFADDAFMLAIFVICMFAFSLFNLRLKGHEKRKIFLGDAGSMVIGFILAWFTIELSQEPKQCLRPVVFLWILLVPLCDAIRLIALRLSERRSPFKPGRDHLHHLLADLGWSVNKIVVFYLLSTLVFSAIGIGAYYSGLKDSISFTVLCIFFVSYCIWCEKLSRRG